LAISILEGQERLGLSATITFLIRLTAVSTDDLQTFHSAQVDAEAFLGIVLAEAGAHGFESKKVATRDTFP
jgi:hypothetical protein